MKKEDLILISVDDHIIEPPDMFDQHMPPSLRSRAPKLHTRDDGSHYWNFEGIKTNNIGLNAVVGRPREEYGMEPTNHDQLRKGTWDVDARIDDMNANGILASANFGTFVDFDGAFLHKCEDEELRLAVLQAYNDWHIDEWCGKYPGRFIPLALVPYWDPKLAVKEVERVVAKGVKGISFPDNPTVQGAPSIHNEVWESLWKVCNDNRVVVNCHIGTGHPPPHPSMESPIDAWITTMPISIANSAADWLQLEALHRYPDLKIALTEGGIGWIPYLVERADFTYEHHSGWTHTDFRGKKPSEVFREHFLTCFLEDTFGLDNRDYIGVDTIMYECDYPHSDTQWPEVPECLMKSFESIDISDEDINKVTHLNAMREFSFDPFSILGRENCTVGALRAQAVDVDTSIVSQGGAAPLSQGEKRVVRSADILDMYAACHGQAKE